MTDASAVGPKAPQQDRGRLDLAAVIAELEAVYDTHWEQVPVGYGALATKAKDVLATGMVPVRPSTAVPVRLLQELEPFVVFTHDTAAHLLTETALLGDALGSDLSTMPIAELRLVAAAVFRLRDAPPANPAWSRPSAAAAAAVALATLGEEVRATTAARQHIHRDFTEEVWDLPCVRQDVRIDRWWQLRTRQQARRELSSVRRTARPVTDVKRILATLHDVSDLRGRLGDRWAPLRSHLGWFADAPIPDAEGAAAALLAVQSLQEALGDRLDPAKIAELAEADAFVAVELTAPAEAIVDAIAAWAGLARRFGGPEPTAFTVAELQQWAQVTADSLDVLRFLHERTSTLRSVARSVAETLDDAVARDRVEDLRDPRGLTLPSDRETS